MQRAYRSSFRLDSQIETRLYFLGHQTYHQRQLFFKDEYRYENRPGERSKKGSI